MRNWLLRGLVFAAVMTVVRLIQGTIINAWPTQAALVSIGLLLLFAIGVAAWGLFDGRADATANPDPDRREDLAMTWLLAGLVAGILSGAVCWVISQFYEGLYTGGLINEITTFAAFTALLVFLPGIIGVAVGRWRVDRNPPPRREGTAEEERADTDVFSAVRADEDADKHGVDAPAGEVEAAGALTQERAAAPTALAEREAPTEAISTPKHEAPTETIPVTEDFATTEDDAKTEVLDLNKVKPEPEPKPDFPSGPWRGPGEKP